ncbi:MAG: AraC family transcriptional regulator [Pyrinomonadaceae bacterium]|nr:AraC family transcriptional regulator [Pyrinomonadaceae bacterium]
MENKTAQFSSEITDNRYFEGLTAGTTSYQKGIINDCVHSHDNPTICFMLHGGGVEKRSRSSYERNACDLRFYHAEEPHQSIIKVFPSKCVNLDLEEKFLRQYEISETLLNLSVNKNLDAKLLMLKIHSELLVNDSLTNSSIKILFLSMLDQTKSSNRLKKPEWITKLSELLNDRWMETLNLDDLATNLKVHPVTISKHFTKYFSCTLGEYMRKVKIEKSISLIKNSQLSLTEIALQCGFADQSHFTRNFKKLTGFLPKNFRNL